MSQYRNMDPTVRHLRFLSEAGAKAAAKGGEVVKLTAKGVRFSSTDSLVKAGRFKAGELDPRTLIASHRAAYGHLSARDPKSWGAHNRAETERFKQYLVDGKDVKDFAQHDAEMVIAESGYRTIKNLPNATPKEIIVEVATRFDVPASTQPKPASVPVTTAPKATVTADTSPKAQQRRSIARKKTAKS